MVNSSRGSASRRAAEWKNRTTLSTRDGSLPEMEDRGSERSIRIEVNVVRWFVTQVECEAIDEERTFEVLRASLGGA